MAGVWQIALEKGPSLARLLPLLDAAERKRAESFTHESDRMAFVRSHAALRLLLGATLQRPAASLAIGSTERDGKPRIDPLRPGPPPLVFSLAHSGSHALVGIVRNGRIGVDLEARGVPDGWRALAERHFADDERRWLLTQPATRQGFRFLQCWTRKEAYLKAIGQGFSRSPLAFRCRLDGDDRVVGSAFDPSGRPLPQWHVLALDAPPVAACAVVDFVSPTLKIEDFDWTRAIPR